MWLASKTDIDGALKNQNSFNLMSRHPCEEHSPEYVSPVVDWNMAYALNIFWCTCLLPLYTEHCWGTYIITTSTSLPLWLQEREEERQRLRLADGYEGWIVCAALLCFKIPLLNLVLSSMDFEKVEVLSLCFGTHYNIPLHGFAMPLKCVVLWSKLMDCVGCRFKVEMTCFLGLVLTWCWMSQYCCTFRLCLYSSNCIQISCVTTTFLVSFGCVLF